MRTLAVLAMAVATGCVQGSEGHASDDGPRDHTEVVAGPLTAVTPSGVSVQLDPGPDELTVGLVALTISFPDVASAEADLSIDVVAPEMPSHGVVRFPVEATDDPSVFVARPEIPMEGRWLAYVNLGYGDDAAEFELNVSPGEEEHVHGTMAGPETGDSPDSERPEGSGGGHVHP